MVFQKFYCGGRLVFGADASSLLLTICMIGGPAITFCIRMAYLISHRHPFFHSIILMGAILLTFMVHKALIFTVNLLCKPGHTLRQIHPSLTCSLYAGFHFSLLDIIERPRDYPKEQRCAWGRDSWCYHPIDRMGEQQIRKCETTSDERCNGEWLHCQSEILWYLSAIPSSSCLSLLNLQQLCPKVWSSLSMGRSVHRLGKSYWNSILTSKTKNWIRSMSWYVIYGLLCSVTIHSSSVSYHVQPSSASTSLSSHGSACLKSMGNSMLSSLMT